MRNYGLSLFNCFFRLPNQISPDNVCQVPASVFCCLLSKLRSFFKKRFFQRKFISAEKFVYINVHHGRNVFMWRTKIFGNVIIGINVVTSRYVQCIIHFHLERRKILARTRRICIDIFFDIKAAT